MGHGEAASLSRTKAASLKLDDEGIGVVIEESAGHQLLG